TRSAPAASNHHQSRRSRSAPSPRTSPSAAAHAASAPDQTQASGRNPPWTAPSAGIRRSGIAATACSPRPFACASAREGPLGTELTWGSYVQEQRTEHWLLLVGRFAVPVVERFDAADHAEAAPEDLVRPRVPDRV